MTGVASDAFGVSGGVVMFNAMVGRELYVLCEGKPRRLPRVNRPVLVDDHQRVGGFTVQVPRDLDGPISAVTGGGWEGVVDLVECTQESKPFILGDLPKFEGVVYVVDPEVISEFPHRTDFVTPATYVMWRPAKWGKVWDGGNGKAPKGAKKAKKWKKKLRAREKMLSRMSADVGREKFFPLASVRRGPLPTAHPDTPVLDLN